MTCWPSSPASFTGGSCGSGTVDRAGPQGRARAASGGFTLPEVIVAVLIVGLLAVLVSAELSGARQAARRAGSIANLRTHAAAISAYTGDYAEVFPYLTDPRATYSVLRCGDQARRVEYFAVAFHWHFGLADGYYGGDCDSPAFWPPGMRRSYTTPYYYSANFISGPEFWDPATRAGPEQWRPIRQGDVLFPASKGILWNRAAYPGLAPDYPAGLPEAAFTDGSAACRPARDFLPPYRNGEGLYPGTYFTGYGLPVLHTLNGVRGRDVR